jgi:hypothetical protein
MTNLMDGMAVEMVRLEEVGIKESKQEKVKG